MKTLFAHRKLLIGVVHLKPLPGSPRWGGDLEALIEFAVQDARSYVRGGAHALFLENFGDVPFTKCEVAPETIKDIPVDMTVVNGKIAFMRGGIRDLDA